MKILIVDDSEAVREKLKKELVSQGYQVIEGSDGQQGLDLADTNPDLKLVICDVNMPRMDGITMSKKIHEKELLKKVPIIVMTTEATSEMKAKGKEAGVLAWVTKPYVTDKLLAAVAKIVK